MTREDLSAEEAAKRRFIDAGIQAAKGWGIGDAAGALKGSLMLADGPMSMDELVETTGYSKSTVSTNMTFLEDRGVVRRVRKPGDKRNYYVTMQDIDESFKAENERLKQIMQVHIAAIDEAERLLEDAELSKEADRLRQRFASMREDCTKAQRLIDLADHFTMDELIQILERETKEHEAKEQEARER